MLGEVTTVYVFLIELGSLLLYCYRVFGVRRRIPSTLLMGIACFAVYYAVNKLADNNVAVNIIFGFLVNYVILKLGFKANVKSAVFHSVLLAGVLTATEFIGILLISGFFGINIADYRSNDVLYAMAAVIAKTLYLISCLVISNFTSREKQHIDHGHSWYLLISPFSSVYIIVLIAKLSLLVDISGTLAYACIGGSVLLFISDIMVFAVYENMQRKSEEIMKVNMERQREDINRDYYAVLDKQNENMHIMVHDIKNHLGVIESIADNDKVTAYIGELCSNIGKYYAVSQLTGNKMLDIIIGKYTALCSKNGLYFNAKALTSNLSFVHDSDISAMVGNLLDNAFEAAKQAENGKIEFSLYTIDSKSCVVSVINTALTAPKCENETLVSAKPDAKSHGYGIKSIKKTAEKYGGSYSWFYDDKNREFHAMVMLPISSASC